MSTILKYKMLTFYTSGHYEKFMRFCRIQYFSKPDTKLKTLPPCYESLLNGKRIFSKNIPSLSRIKRRKNGFQEFSVLYVAFLVLFLVAICFDVDESDRTSERLKHDSY